MIITELNGGLGNQLFQYAFGLAVAKQYGTDLKFDIQALQGSDSRPFALDKFNIAHEIASPKDIRRILAMDVGILRWIAGRVSPRALRRYSNRYIDETKISFINNELFHISNDAYLKGYWQNERFFRSAAKEVKSSVILKTPLSDKSQKVANQINTANSVGIHIRRGDYVSNPTANSHHGICSLDYYSEAIQRILIYFPSAKFFVFSDDIPWCMENLNFNSDAIYVNHNGTQRSHEDFALLSMCKHHIIANSSFSWWAAWLNDAQGKTIAPQNWYRSSHRKTQDIIPPRWTVL